MRKPYAIKNLSPDKKFSSFYKPMLATLTNAAFDDKHWIFEIKWDGYRAIVDWQGKKLKFYSRNGLSFNDKFPSIAEALTKLKHDVVLDGEIVVIDENNKPSFQKLQHYEDNTHLPLIYYVFDILFLDKKDVKDLPLLQRKELLQKLLAKSKIPNIKYCDHVEEFGKDFYTASTKAKLEGIIAKKSDSTYTCNIRSKEWLKVKNINTREGIIVGYTKPRNSRSFFGALILAEYADGELKYMGHTGTGFDEKKLKELSQIMQPLVTANSPFTAKVKVNMPVTWLKPKLVCEVNYSEVTEDGLLRHPVFIALRKDKKFTEVKKYEQDPQPLKAKDDKAITLNKHTIILTNLSKVYWPDDGITKGDMLEYYKKVAPYILPYLQNRPLSLKRNPNGIADEGFYHKDAGEQAPTWIKKFNVESGEENKIIHYIMANEEASLLYAANLGCIEMNPWNSTYKKPEHPTYMVIDIDPSPKNSFDEVIETARVVKEILDKAGADCYCKTSGATGLHIYVPLGNKYTYEQSKNFGHLVAHLTNLQLPETTSLERSLSKRGNKIYVDFLQNRRGQTLAAAYSLRPKAGATVSTPLQWKEVKKGLHPSDFTIETIHKRLAKVGDLFAPVLDKGIDLKGCLNKLESK